MPMFLPKHVKKRMRTFYVMNANNRGEVSDMAKARARFIRQSRAGAQFATVRRVLPAPHRR